MFSREYTPGFSLSKFSLDFLFFFFKEKRKDRNIQRKRYLNQEIEQRRINKERVAFFSQQKKARTPGNNHAKPPGKTASLGQKRSIRTTLSRGYVLGYAGNCPRMSEKIGGLLRYLK